MDERDDQTVDKGAELSAGPDSAERAEERRDAERATDQDIPEEESDAMHGRG
jgi:hypothetical protein